MLSCPTWTWQIFSVSGHNTCTHCQEHLGPAPGQVKGTLGTLSGPPLPSPRTSASSLDTCPPLLDLDSATHPPHPPPGETPPPIHSECTSFHSLVHHLRAHHTHIPLTLCQLSQLHAYPRSTHRTAFDPPYNCPYYLPDIPTPVPMLCTQLEWPCRALSFTTIWVLLHAKPC